MEVPYYQAARYPNKTAAGKAYTPIQQIIHDEDCDLSAYRLWVPRERKWYVVVIGEKPTTPLHERLKTILMTLARGEAARLDEDTRSLCFWHDAFNRRNAVIGSKATIPYQTMRNKQALCSHVWQPKYRALASISSGSPACGYSTTYGYSPTKRRD